MKKNVVNKEEAIASSLGYKPLRVIQINIYTFISLHRMVACKHSQSIAYVAGNHEAIKEQRLIFFNQHLQLKMNLLKTVESVDVRFLNYESTLHSTTNSNPMRKTEFTIFYQPTGGQWAKFGENQNAGRLGWLVQKSLNWGWQIALILMMLTGFSNQMLAQCALVCNDDVNISLPGPNSDCELTITDDMVIEDPSSCGNPLIVTIMDAAGNILSSNPAIINADQIGQTLTFQVMEDAPGGNSCWGMMDIEDKLGPEITNCDNLDLYCAENTLPTVDGGDVPTPTFDDCSFIVSTSYYDTYLDGDCTDPYVGIITREWTAIDEYNNTSSCTQTITITRVTLADPNIILGCPNEITLECDVNGAPSTAPDVTGYPTVELDGNVFEIIPGANILCELASSFSDEIFPLCGGGEKILRTWTIYDWCAPTSGGINPNPWNCIQVIKIEDLTSPTVTSPPIITEGSSSNSCSANLMLPPAAVWDACSSVDVKVITPFGTVNGNGGLLQNVPVGTHLITYQGTDECGNMGTSASSLIVVDDTPPIAVCDEHTTVSVTGDGTATVAAVVFDDGSVDNCAIDYFEVQRLESNCQGASTFDTYVEFDCCDIGEVIGIVLRIVDIEGNFNECMIDVEVEDKIKPVMVCPPNKTIECSDPIPPVTDPTVSDNCPNVTWEVNEIENINSCGVGFITRTYTATDASGLSVSCTQEITIVNSTSFTLGDIGWPLDYETTTCGASLEPDVLPAGYNEPSINDSPCDLVAVTYTDQPLPTNPPACYKILRNWIVIDWCQFDPNAPGNGGIWEHVQILKVEDVVAPVISCPSDITVGSLDADCNTGYVEVSAVSAVDCSNDFDYEITIDYNQDGSIDMIQNDADASGYYPFGTHEVNVSVEDNCGNTSFCSFIVTVEDAKKPSPICVNGIAVELMPDGNGGGMIEIEASTFNSGSYDNCTAEDDLLVTITPTSFTCINIGTNIVTLWVTDEAGNSDYCETYVIIQDNQGLCPFGANIAGTIETELGLGVNDVMVDVSGNGPATTPVATNGNGYYEFIDLDTGYDYTFTPFSDAFPLNGVTTFDLVLITKHVINDQPLDSPYKIIAADANKSGSVTTLDIVELRKLILNIYPTFPNNNSWRFVEGDFVFPNPTDPFSSGFPEIYNVNNLINSSLDVDFTAVKIGDVNNSALPDNLLGADDRNTFGELTFEINNQTIQPNEVVKVDFSVNDLTNILGYQFTLEYDENALEFLDIQNGELNNISTSNFGLTLVDEGIITTSWHNQQEGQAENNTLHNTNLFSLTFRAKTNAQLSDLLQINSRYTQAEAYADISNAEELEMELLDVQLQFDNGIQSGNDFELFQNEPNPFSEVTMISFQLSNNEAATLSIYDVSGKILKVVSGNFEKGYNEIRVDKSDLRSTGVLYYRLETSSDLATRKMIVLD